jgi:hypothetical protein
MVQVLVRKVNEMSFDYGYSNAWWANEDRSGRRDWLGKWWEVRDVPTSRERAERRARGEQRYQRERYAEEEQRRKCVGWKPSTDGCPICGNMVDPRLADEHLKVSHDIYYVNRSINGRLYVNTSGGKEGGYPDALKYHSADFPQLDRAVKENPSEFSGLEVLTWNARTEGFVSRLPEPRPQP